MKIIRFYETDNHDSRFEEIDIPFPESKTDAGYTYCMSRPFDAGAILAELPVGLNQDWHVAPNRQFVVVLTGRLEVETSDGEKRQWGPGEMFMADDTGGQGHRTRVLDGPAKLLFMRVPLSFDPRASMAG